MRDLASGNVPSVSKIVRSHRSSNWSMTSSGIIESTHSRTRRIPRDPTASAMSRGSVSLYEPRLVWRTCGTMKRLDCLLLRSRSVQ